MVIEPNDNEVECVELMEDQSVRLCDLEVLLPALMNKYGNKAVLRFAGVVIAPTNSTRLRKGVGGTPWNARQKEAK